MTRPDCEGRPPICHAHALLPWLAAGPPTAIIAVIVGGIVLGILVAIAGYRAKKKRQEALRAWAAQHGFHYQPDDVSTLENRFGDFGCLTQGSNRYGYNVMRGDLKDRHAWAFDYHYETHSTDSKGRRQTHHHRFSAVVLDSGLALQPLSIRTEGFLDRITQAFGFDDIDFESAEFSRTFHVKAPDKRWAYTVIHQDTMEFLLASPRFRIECSGPWIIAWRNRMFDPVTFDSALGVINGILDRLPRDVVKSLGGSAPDA